MAHLPASDTASSIDALRAEIGGLRSDLHAEITTLRDGVHTEISTLREETHTEISTLREETHAEASTIRAEMHAEIRGVHDRLDRLFITLVTGLFVIVAAMAGVVVAGIV